VRNRAISNATPDHQVFILDWQRRRNPPIWEPIRPRSHILCVEITCIVRGVVDTFFVEIARKDGSCTSKILGDKD
jgi:hypothetical protein